jgi:hypothetical protein
MYNDAEGIYYTCAFRNTSAQLMSLTYFPPEVMSRELFVVCALHERLGGKLDPHLPSVKDTDQNAKAILWRQSRDSTTRFDTYASFSPPVKRILVGLLSQVLETLDQARIVHRYVVPESITQILTPTTNANMDAHLAHIMDWAYAELKDKPGGELTPPITFSTSIRFLNDGGEYKYVDDLIAVVQVFLLHLHNMRQKQSSLEPKKAEVVSFWTQVITKGRTARELFSAAEQRDIRSLVDIMRSYAVGVSFPLVRLLEF